MVLSSVSIAVLGAAACVQASTSRFQPRDGLVGILSQTLDSAPASLPAQAQHIDQKAFNVLPQVLPPTESNATTLFLPPGTTKDSLKAQPFHVYDDEFLAIIGKDPKMSLIANRPQKDVAFHEAVVWHPETDEMFFCQNAGATSAGTGLNKSALIYKISLAQAHAVIDLVDATGKVDVVEVSTGSDVINPNGGTNYKGQLLFAAEGQDYKKPSELVVMNPLPPYNTTVLLNNYFGRQFNSLNDVAINPLNNDIYFTDTLYGYLQDFRPAPGLQNQVYRLNDVTGAVTVVADGFVLPNGITFSPSGKKAYVTDTGIAHAHQGWNLSDPSSIYVYDVLDDGTFANRKTFAFVSPGVPDGIHCDTAGNVFVGCGDGVHVFNPSGKLIGKVFLGEGCANFNFAGEGRIVLCAENDLYYVELAATGGSYIQPA